MNKKCYICEYSEIDVNFFSTKAIIKLINYLIDIEKIDTFIFDSDKEFCQICYDIIIRKNKKIICKIASNKNENISNKFNLEKIYFYTHKKGAEAFIEKGFNTIDYCDYFIYFIDFIGNFSNCFSINYAITNNKRIFFILNNCDKYLCLN